MERTAFDILKNGEQDNKIDWLKNMLFVEYARITKVIDSTVVRAQPVAQVSRSARSFVVKLLNVGSSSIREEIVQPQMNDLVLLLFLRSYNPKMYDSPEDRKEAKESETIKQKAPDGYSSFSGVGILAQQARNRAPTVAHYGKDSTGPYIDEKTSARFMKAFKAAVSVAFDVPAVDASTPGPDAPVSLTFGASSPLDIESERGADVAFDGQVNFSSKTGLLIEVAEDEEDSKPPLSLSLSDSGLVLDTGDRSATVDAGDGNVVLNGAEVRLNGSSKSLVTYAALNSALSTLVGSINTLFSTKLDGGGSPGTLTLNLSAAEATTVKTG